MNRIVGIGVMSLFLALFGACARALQPTACSAGAAAREWLGEDNWVRADLVRVQRELACGANPIDHSAEPANLAAALESAARARLMALGGMDPGRD